MGSEIDTPATISAANGGAMGRRSALGALTALTLGVVLGASARPATAQTKPIVVIFPTGRDKVGAVSEQRPGESADGLGDGERIAAAAKTLKAQFDSEGVVEAILYTSAMPMFQRALRDARIPDAASGDPQESDRVKIAAAVGAHYALALYARLNLDAPPANNAPPTSAEARSPQKNRNQKPTVQKNGQQLEIDAIEIRPGGKTGRHWRDDIAVGSGGVAGNDRKRAYQIALDSAARSLVLRFQNGPLREYALATPDPALLPPAPKPPTVAEEGPDDPTAQVGELLRRAAAQVADNRGDAAIQTLRRAVNFAPRSLAPRQALIDTYLILHQPAAAAAEARRTLSVVKLSADERETLTRTLARALIEGGDLSSARDLYASELQTNPDDHETRLALAELMLSQNDAGAAEVQYRILRQKAPDSVEAAQGLGRILAAREDFAAAQQDAQVGSAAARFALSTVVFVSGANALAARAVQNRTSWEEGKMTREAFYQASTMQATRAAQLVSLIQSCPPADSASETAKGSYKRRVLAGSLLSQAITTLVTFLETGEVATGARAKTQIGEFFVEMRDADSVRPIPVKPPNKPVDR